MLKNKGFLYVALIIVSITIIGVSLMYPSKLSEDYPRLNRYNNITVIDTDELIEKINNKESFVVTLGFKECPWCQALVPNLDRAAKEARMPIYYCDILAMRMDPTGPLMDDYEFLKKVFYTLTIDDHKTIGAPSTAAIVNGVFKAGFTDTLPTHIKNEQGVLPPLTEKENDLVVERLLGLFEIIK